MAIQDGQVYLVGDTDLRVMDRQGKTLTEASLENFQPTAITLDERMIYLTDGNTLASLPVDQLSGSLKTLLTLDDPAVITSLAVADGAVFLADAGNRHVWRFDLQDKTRTKIGRRSGRAIAKFVIPSPNFDLLIDQAGLLRVVNPGMLRVEAYTRDGYFEEPLAWGQPGQDWKSFVGCCNPTHLAQLDDGRFVTVEKGTPRVKLYSAQGEAECIIAPTEAFNGDAPIADLATDSQGRVYVLDRHLNDVRIFQPNQATTKP
jgi:sugar lactone lactonase YvrE